MQVSSIGDSDDKYENARTPGRASAAHACVHLHVHKLCGRFPKRIPYMAHVQTNALIKGKMCG